ncbi:hypothetical protein, partial [Bradyrhizobium sp. sBnM-33]|uniref:hypothetical protein n=1 Tax=Bradyrhizobium sp. sBnM-33 TaxID=2831780 RepID=UPI001BCD1634
ISEHQPAQPKTFSTQSANSGHAPPHHRYRKLVSTRRHAIEYPKWSTKQNFVLELDIVISHRSTVSYHFDVSDHVGCTRTSL